MCSDFSLNNVPVSTLDPNIVFTTSNKLYLVYNTTIMCDGVLQYIVSGLFLMFFWCLCMVININVQYNGGFLPDIILWTQCYLHRGRTCLNAMKRFVFVAFDPT